MNRELDALMVELTRELDKHRQINGLSLTEKGRLILRAREAIRELGAERDQLTEVLRRVAGQAPIPMIYHARSDAKRVLAKLENAK